jgi:hypothetical protein
MCSRIVTVALFLCVAFALPVPVYAGECQAVLVFFDDGRDILDVISLEDTGRTIVFPSGRTGAPSRVIFWYP